MGSVAVTERPLLLDTVAFIFWHANSPRLPERVRDALRASKTRPIYVSVVSAFEISTKARLGKLHVPAPLIDEFQYVVESDGFRLLELNAASASRAGQFNSDHRDPFDRLLAAQALALDCDVATLDPVFAAEFSVGVFW